FADIEAAIHANNVDAVIIASPSATHLELAQRAIQAGKHVLVEKPVADDPVAIRQLAAEARARDVVAMPAHNYAYLPEARRVIEIARSGHLGSIRAAFVTYAIAHSEDVASHYGPVLSEVMVHHAYLSLASLGRPTSITAGESRAAWVQHAASDQAWTTWTFDEPGRGGLTAHHFASFAVDDWSSAPDTMQMKLLGTNGTSS